MADTNYTVSVVIDAVNKAKGQLKTASKEMSNFVKQNQQGLQTIRNTSAVAFAGITAAVGGAVSIFKDFEKAMSEVQAVSGATADDMTALNKKAKELGRSTEFTAKQVADGMIFLSRAGFEAGETVAAIGPALDLATAANISLAESADISTNILSQFQGEVEDLPRFMDILSATTASANTDMRQLAEAMKFAGPSLAALGVPLEEVAAVVGKLGNAGLQGSIATRALSTSMTRLAKPTNQMKEVMEQLNLELFDSQGEFVGLIGVVGQLEKATAGMTDEQKQAALATLFGAEAIQEMNVLLDQGAEELQRYTDELNNSEGATENMASVMRDNLEGSLKAAQSALQGVALELGKAVAPALREVLEAVTPVLQKIAERIQKNPELTKRIAKGAIVVTGLVAALAGLATILPAITAAIGLLTGPVGIVLAAITALGVAWSTNFFGIRDITSEVFGEVKALRESFTVEVSAAWNEFLSELGITNDEFWTGFKQTVKLVFQVVKTLVVSNLAFLKEFWGGTFRAIKELVVGIFGGIKDTILGTVKLIKGIVTGDFTKMKEGLTQIFGGLFKILTAPFKAAAEFIEGVVNGIIGSINKITGAINRITGTSIPQIKKVGQEVQKLNQQTAAVATPAQTQVQRQAAVATALGIDGARANGGPVTGGKSFLVGERGPEIFTPSRSGTIIPNGAGGGGVSLSIGNINVSNQADENRLVSKIRDMLTREIEVQRSFNTAVV